MASEMEYRSEHCLALGKASETVLEVASEMVHHSALGMASEMEHHSALGMASEMEHRSAPGKAPEKALCRVCILVFSSPDKQRLYCQGEKEAQSDFELANRMRTSGTSHMSGTYWGIARCATTHGHSRMLYVTLTLFV